MIIYYNLDGDICICFDDIFGEPDVKMHIDNDTVKILAGETQTEVKLGDHIDVKQEGNKLIIDFDADTPEVEGLEMLMAEGLNNEVTEIIIKSEDGDIEVKPGEDPKPIDPEQEADDEAAAAGKKCKANGEYFDNLKEAVALAQPGQALVIKMIADEAGAGIGLFNADGDENKDITVDLNGHKYTATSPAVGSKGTQTQALHLEMNNKFTLKNGEFTSDRNASDIKMLIQNYCDLTLDNVVCDCADDASITYVVSNNFGNCVIKNCELHAHPSRVALDCWFGLGKTYDDGLTVTAQNSILDSVIEYGAQRASLSRTGNEEWWKKAVLTLDHCTFGQINNSGAGANDQHTIIIDGVERSEELPIAAE